MTQTAEEILAGRDTAPAQTVETPTQETPLEQAAPETPPDPDEPQATDVNGQKMVPHAALHASKEKVKRYTEQVASFEKKIEENNQAWERRFNAMLERVTPPQQPQPQQPPVDWFSDPDARLQHEMRGAISPIERNLSSLSTQIMRLSAVQQHGAEKVSAFEKYAQEAMDRNDPEMAALSAQMRSSPDPIGVGLAWFEKKTFDPVAERERIRAELQKELSPQQPAPSAQAFPSNLAGARNVGNRSGPQWAGPPSIQDIFKR